LLNVGALMRKYITSINSKISLPGTKSVHKFPAIKGNELKRFCEKLGFKITRQRGSHVRMRHDDGRVKQRDRQISFAAYGGEPR
jgi:hypothetical protein